MSLIILNDIFDNSYLSSDSEKFGLAMIRPAASPRCAAKRPGRGRRGFFTVCGGKKDKSAALRIQCTFNMCRHIAL